MSEQTLAPRTPITAKADRSDCRVRLLEEAILMLRGQWPSAATGLCMSVNSLYGFTRDRQAGAPQDDQRERRRGLAPRRGARRPERNRRGPPARDCRSPRPETEPEAQPTAFSGLVAALKRLDQLRTSSSEGHGSADQVEPIGLIQIARRGAGLVEMAVLPDDPLSAFVDHDNPLAVVVRGGDQVLADRHRQRRAIEARPYPSPAHRSRSRGPLA